MSGLRSPLYARSSTATLPAVVVSAASAAFRFAARFSRRSASSRLGGALQMGPTARTPSVKAAQNWRVVLMVLLRGACHSGGTLPGSCLRYLRIGVQRSQFRKHQHDG